MAEPEINENEIETQAPESVQEAPLQAQDMDPALLALLEELRESDGKTIQVNPETNEFISTNVETGEVKQLIRSESVDGVEVQQPPNQDDFITVVENGEMNEEGISLLQEKTAPEQAETLETEQPEVTTNEAEASAPAADAAAVTADIEQTRKDADARIVRETAEADGEKQFFGMDAQEFLNMLMAVITGDFDSLKNVLEEMKANEDENKQEAPKQEVAQETPEKTPADETPEAEEEHDGPTAIVQEDAPKGYVTENGQGPLLTEVNKQPDPEVSPLIALALGQDGPSEQNILGGIFSMNAANEVGNEQVIQVPFRAEPPVTDPSTTPMQVAEVNEPAANADDYEQSAPKTLAMGS